METEEFEWDDDKNTDNIRNHAIAFDTAFEHSMMKGRFHSRIANIAVLENSGRRCSGCAKRDLSSSHSLIAARGLGS